MSDTSKATPRPWRKGAKGTKVNGRDVFALLTCKHGDFRDKLIASYLWSEADADLIVALVNSYNPKRDKLARELAEVALGKGDLIWRAHVRKLATQLLKLYEEEK